MNNAHPEQSEPTVQPIRPPQLIQSLVGGFNAVAGNISLIALPVALDLLLWFGPHLRLQTLLGPGLRGALTWMRDRGAAESRPAVDALQTQLAQFLEQYNLLSALSTFPVGLPSRMAALAPLKTPIGAAPILEVRSYAQFLFGWLALLLLGFLAGSLYFALIARACTPRPLIPGGREAQAPDNPCVDDLPYPRPEGETRRRGLLWKTAQIVWMMALLLAALLVLMAPLFVISLVLALISPLVAQFVLLVIAFSTIWFLTPLVFTPHGIFLCGQGVFRAMLYSTRVARLSLPGTALFLLTLLVLQQGLGVLWNSPTETSWMTLVGIFGHAFINTALLAAMFFYYRGGLHYIQFLRSGGGGRESGGGSRETAGGRGSAGGGRAGGG